MSCHGQLVTLRWSAPAPLASSAGRLLFLLLVRPDQRDRYGDADVVHALGHRHCSRHVQQLLGTGLTTGGCRPTWNAPPRAGGPHPEHQTTGPAALLLLTRPASLAIRSTQARRSRSDALTLLVRQVTQAHGRHHRVLDRRRGTSPDEGVGAGAHRHAGRPADRHGAPHQRAGRAQDHRGADPRVHPRHRQGTVLLRIARPPSTTPTIPSARCCFRWCPAVSGPCGTWSPGTGTRADLPALGQVASAARTRQRCNPRSFASPRGSRCPQASARP
jgi:hypothetical protein